MNEKQEEWDMYTWKDYKTWLTSLDQPVPTGLESPEQVAAFEAALFCKKQTGYAFRLVSDAEPEEGYRVSKEQKGENLTEITVRGGRRGILYGTYATIFALVSGVKLPEGLQKPAFALRMLDSWDNMDGSVERGYAGRSLWFGGGRFCYETERILQLGRMLSSVGINVLCINNVNVQPPAGELIGSALFKTAAFAALLRPFGIRLMLSVDFAAPVRDLHTADPLDRNVRLWWKACAERVWQAIPDLAGFLVKADSEFRPGPSSYGRTHAQGANMLQEAVAPYGGTIVWRAFVYDCKQDWRDTRTDRPCAAYNLYRPLDGLFSDDVILQVKYGPYDFQAQEPISPLFWGLEKTRPGLELQITQEYTGQQIDLFAMPPLWEHIFSKLRGVHLSAVAGVSNLGRDANWTGHPFAALNLFAFGQFAWNPEAGAEEITRRWIRLSGYGDDEEMLTDLLLHSGQIYQQYTDPLGLCWMVRPGIHYGPDPWGYEFQAWGTYNRADREGVGIDRTNAGTGFINQYPPQLASKYAHPATCPDQYLLFFHRLPYNYVMRDGRTLIQRIYDDHFEGYEKVKQMQEMLDKLHLAPEDADIVRNRMDMQVSNAREWRDVVNTFFHRLSGIEDDRGRRIYP